MLSTIISLAHPPLYPNPLSNPDLPEAHPLSVSQRQMTTPAHHARPPFQYQEEISLIHTTSNSAAPSGLSSSSFV